MFWKKKPKSALEEVLDTVIEHNSSQQKQEQTKDISEPVWMIVNGNAGKESTKLSKTPHRDPHELFWIYPLG